MMKKVLFLFLGLVSVLGAWAQSAPVDATIDKNEILFWVGEGSNAAIVAVNWANPDTCLAWGVRFEGQIALRELMDIVVAADPRFGYVANSYGIEDITFAAGADTLRLHGPYWLYNVNGSAAQLGYAEQPVLHGDFIKWGDVSVGVGYDWNDAWQYFEQYAWITPVTPVSVYHPASIACAAGASLSMWPNPATDCITVSTDAPAEAILYDLSGRRMAAIQLATGDNLINLSSLASGIYLLRTATSAHKIVKR